MVPGAFAWVLPLEEAALDEPVREPVLDDAALERPGVAAPRAGRRKASTAGGARCIPSSPAGREVRRMPAMTASRRQTTVTTVMMDPAVSPRGKSRVESARRPTMGGERPMAAMACSARRPGGRTGMRMACRTRYPGRKSHAGAVRSMRARLPSGRNAAQQAAATVAKAASQRSRRGTGAASRADRRRLA